MNIFYLDPNPDCAAIMQHDKHVVKMTLETAQILCTVYHMHGLDAPYKTTHKNHPCVLWASGTREQYTWLWEHGMSLAYEYSNRYGGIHASQVVIQRLQQAPMQATGWKDPPQCMPDAVKVPYNTVAAYQQYYLAHKVAQSRWTNRDVPLFVQIATTTTEQGILS